MKNLKARRPVHCRCVEDIPKFTCFLPEGIASDQSENLVLGLDEVEAIRLADQMSICIEGGNVRPACGGFESSRDRVRVCLYCGFEQPHVQGVPCRTLCGKPLMRKGRCSSVA